MEIKIEHSTKLIKDPLILPVSFCVLETLQIEGVVDVSPQEKLGGLLHEHAALVLLERRPVVLAAGVASFLAVPKRSGVAGHKLLAFGAVEVPRRTFVHQLLFLPVLTASRLLFQSGHVQVRARPRRLHGN
jgi:hypothetical protein